MIDDEQCSYRPTHATCVFFQTEEQNMGMATHRTSANDGTAVSVFENVESILTD